MDLAMQFVLLCIGFFMLTKGADWFVEGASKIADRFGIPQLVIGLTIVAFGTSAPEAAISITAALKGNAEITVGNIIGSNILNILLILGIASLIIPLKIQQSTLSYELPFIILVSAVLYFQGIDGVIDFYDALVLLLLFLVFLFYLYRIAQNGNQDAEVAAGQQPAIPKMLLLTLAGITVVIIGSDLSVNSATRIAKLFGISDRVIGLTIVAFGTSLPELLTSVMAAIKGKDDIAIGNIVGSNIFNILFVVGTAGIITPIVYASNFLFDNLAAIAAAVLLLFCVLKDRKLRRSGGILMLLVYGIYFINLIHQ